MTTAGRRLRYGGDDEADRGDRHQDDRLAGQQTEREDHRGHARRRRRPATRPSRRAVAAAGVGPGLVPARARRSGPVCWLRRCGPRCPSHARWPATVPRRQPSPASRCTGTDSPVSADSSKPARVRLVRRRSAGTMSPASSRTRSPRTRSAAGTIRSAPSRTTRAVGAASSSSAAIAASARTSWTTPMSGVDHDHQGDDRGVRQIPERRGDHGSDDEQGDQRVGQLAADAGQQTSRRRSCHDVGTVHGEPLGGLCHGETTRTGRSLRVHDASSRRLFSTPT